MLTNLPPFTELPADARQALMKEATHQQHDKGSMLFMQGDAANALYVVMRGRIKLFRETLDGQESLIALCSAGEVLGEAGLAEPGTYPFSAQAHEKSELIRLPMRHIQALMEQYPAFSLRVFNRAMQHARQLELKIEHITSMNAPQRIGCYFLSLCPEHDTGQQILTLPVDKALIAAELGMKPETFSRALQQLKQWGVQVEGDKVNIHNIRSLQQQACISCSNTVQCLSDDAL